MNFLKYILLRVAKVVRYVKVNICLRKRCNLISVAAHCAVKALQFMVNLVILNIGLFNISTDVSEMLHY